MIRKNAPNIFLAAFVIMAYAITFLYAADYIGIHDFAASNATVRVSTATASNSPVTLAQLQGATNGLTSGIEIGGYVTNFIGEAAGIVNASAPDAYLSTDTTLGFDLTLNGDQTINGSLTVNGAQTNTTVVNQYTTINQGTNFVAANLYTTNNVTEVTDINVVTNNITTNTVDTVVNVGGSVDYRGAEFVYLPNLYDEGTNASAPQVTASNTWDFTGATVLMDLFSGSGTTGLVTSAAGDAGNFLRADGTWAAVGAAGGITNNQTGVTLDGTFNQGISVISGAGAQFDRGILTNYVAALFAVSGVQTGLVWSPSPGDGSLYLSQTGWVAAAVGDVTVTGTPADSQLAVWTAASDIEGDTALTFDTSTDTLTIGGGTSVASIVLPEASGNGSSTWTIKPPAALDASYVLTLPINDGDADQVLKTDGNGALSWTTPSGGGVNDGDTLGTGLTFPIAGLHILDTDTTHDLILSPGSNLTADRTLTITTGDADRTLTLNGNVTLNASVVDATGTPANNQVAVWTDSNTIEGDGDLTFDGTTLSVLAGLTLGNNTDGNRTITWDTLTGDYTLIYDEVTDNRFEMNAALDASALTEGGAAVPNSADNLAFFAATTSSQLAGVISDETGTGAVVLNDDPDILGRPTFGDGATQAGGFVIKEDSDDGTDTITIQGQAIAASYTLTLPTTDGDTDQYLKTDGSGGLSWGAPGGAPGGDTDAIHDNVAGEINAISEKVSPVSADLLLIEDSAAANAKKKVQIGNLPGSADGDGLTYSSGGDSATAMNVNTSYQVDMSAWATSDHIYSLPTTAAVGDRVQIVISKGNASYELLIQTTAASNDTINGVDHDSTPWSKLFISGESIMLVCVVADTDWVVVRDGRIPCKVKMHRNGTNQTMTDNTPDQIEWTHETFDVGAIGNTTNYEVVTRRAGKYRIDLAVQNLGTLSGGGELYLQVRTAAGAANWLLQNNKAHDANAAVYTPLLSGVVSAADGDTFESWLQFNYVSGSGGDIGGAETLTSFTVTEILP